MAEVDPALDRACAIVAHKDAQPLRRALFAQKAARTPAIRAALATWARLGSGAAATAFVAGYAAKSFAELRTPTTDASIWTVAQYPNEARQFAALQVLDPSLTMAAVRFGRVPRLVRAELGGAWDLVAEYVRRGDFLVAARVASTVGYYLRLLPALGRSRARAVLVSSDANPYAVALVAAAERLGRRTAFVAHGHVAEDPPPLRFDLAILDGPAVRDVYARAGAISGDVVYRGVEGAIRPMRVAPLRTLGVFTSILVDWKRVADAIVRLRSALAPERVLLRLHPNREMRDPHWAHALDLRNVTVSDGARTIEDDTAECQLVACGSSSAHLSVVKLGVPSLYVRALDELDDDYYRFVALGAVPRLETHPDARAIAGFFEDAGWPARFARFDAAYPDRQDACDRDVRDALRALVQNRDA